jgi:hypothetical protein
LAVLKDWYKNGYHPVTVKVAKTLKHQIDATAKEKKMSQRIFAGGHTGFFDV